MVQLFDWYLVQGVAQGICQGHVRLEDGLFIHTSRILDVQVEEDAVHLHTYSGTHYYCKLEDINLEEFESTKAQLQMWDVDISFLSTIEEKVEVAKREYEAQLVGKLSDNDFFIELKGYITKKAYLKKDGKLIEAEVKYHCGMFQDSYLLLVPGVVDVRYWDRVAGIHFYHVSDGVERICIKCTSGYDFTIEGIGESIVISENDTEMKVIKVEDSYEGLISPDLVNGKSALWGMMPEDTDDSGEEAVRAENTEE